MAGVQKASSPLSLQDRWSVLANGKERFSREYGLAPWLWGSREAAPRQFLSAEAAEPLPAKQARPSPEQRSRAEPGSPKAPRRILAAGCGAGGSGGELGTGRNEGTPAVPSGAGASPPVPAGRNAGNGEQRHPRRRSRCGESRRTWNGIVRPSRSGHSSWSHRRRKTCWLCHFSVARGLALKGFRNASPVKPLEVHLGNNHRGPPKSLDQRHRSHPRRVRDFWPEIKDSEVLDQRQGVSWELSGSSTQKQSVVHLRNVGSSFLRKTRRSAGSHSKRQTVCCAGKTRPLLSSRPPGDDAFPGRGQAFLGRRGDSQRYLAPEGAGACRGRR
ncbi:uncharacterized protein LOC121359421 [Pyrgilauda ruficollis]|uniref:uncharacterized protein LOC121359421 n=1 Tax=Pyrgilauda ruficollis TaxID=221976 RepID=UPI001B85F7BB|nr:uncharacterized protein LOC121359421 [Pyrgilauda ruficollis]